MRLGPNPVLSSSEEPALDLSGKVHQLEVMLKQLHTDLQKVRPHAGPSQPPATFFLVPGIKPIPYYS